MRSIGKLLIANRGEIAVRLIRACRELGIVAVAVYSDADRAALHVRLADEAYRIGQAPALQSYLDVEAVLEAARRSGADAVHPGYGFLSERAHFARACTEAGLVFVGPPPEAIQLMGSKIAARRLAVAHDVPVVPGYDGDDQRLETLQREAALIGFPLFIKASAGGGGKGMRAVIDAAGFATALEGAQREARAAFGDDAVLLEKLIVRPRHVEFQVMADNHGNVVHLHERECSIQRRHQKIVEEAPCIALSDELRAEIGSAAVRLARAASYRNAGTVEFMLDPGGGYYFLEMNTRLQVEHPVTELASGYDLVHLQLAVATGQPLPFTQEEVRLRGHAIEVRVYAEDPVTFLPVTGPLAALIPPDGPGIRNDLGLDGGDAVTVHYDPMVAKLIVHAADRPSAIRRLRRAIDDYAVLGLTTNLALLRAIAAHPAFEAGDTHTGFLEEAELAETLKVKIPAEVLVAAAMSVGQDAELERDPFALLWRSSGTERRSHFDVDRTRHTVSVTPDRAGTIVKVADLSFPVELVARRGAVLTLRFGQRQERFFVAEAGTTCFVQWRGMHYQLHRTPALTVDTLHLGMGPAAGHASLEAPMSGTVVKILVDEGQAVAAREPLVVLEAMKMEHTIAAPYAGVVTRIHYTVGQLVAGGAPLVELDAQPEGATPLNPDSVLSSGAEAGLAERS